MPRIDPYQLLKCLSVLLSPTGGIKSKNEVNRLASLMTKFSKKLVSKCIYVLILKATDTEFLDLFMSAGGWDLTFGWLNDGIAMKNWPLVEELVELLLLCPVDIERMKGNNCPKLIKHLSKDPTATERVRDLACKVVEQWLAIVKGACDGSSIPPNQAVRVVEPVEEETKEEIISGGILGVSQQLPVYKITIRDGKQVLAEVITSERVEHGPPQVVGGGKRDIKEIEGEGEVGEDEEMEDIENEKRMIEGEGGLRSAQIGKKRIPQKKNELIKKKVQVVEGKKDLSEVKSIEKIKKSKDKKVKIPHPPPLPTASQLKLGKDKLKEQKDKLKIAQEEEQNEKDKATLAKLVSPPLTNLGKIPRKVNKEEIAGSNGSEKKEEKRLERKPVEPAKPLPKDPKKYNISIEPRKGQVPSERPKTVKTYNSKFRSTGLEEVPPPPKSKKVLSNTVVGTEMEERKGGGTKRSSPTKESPPEKKHHKEEKSSHHEKSHQKEEKSSVGGNHLNPVTRVPSPSQQLPPKPKINFLQESDVFADALTAANPVKDIKKKKRRASLTENKKDSPKSEEKKGHQEPPEKKPALKFYQDTLVTSEDRSLNSHGLEGMEIKEDKIKVEAIEEESVIKEELGSVVGGPMTKEEVEDEVAKAEEAITMVLKQEEKKNEEREKNRLPKGILAYIKKKRIIKKFVHWKPEPDLESTKYFELDETERVNVTKPFTDMKQMERINERENNLMSRKLPVDDVMEEKTFWRPLTVVEVDFEQIVPGKNSLEKDIQFARERTVLQALYFNKKTIPDTPYEPDLEIHATTEPALIPLDDQTGNTESVISYRHKPWPEPKGYPPGALSGGGRGNIGGNEEQLQHSPPLHNPHIPTPATSFPIPHVNHQTSPIPPPQSGFLLPQPGPPSLVPPNNCGFYPFPPQPTPPPIQGHPPSEWGMGGSEGGGNGAGGMMGGVDMMMSGGGVPPGMMPGGGGGGGPEMYAMGQMPPPEFMGGPPMGPPHFMGPPMFFPPGPRPPPHWGGGAFRQNGPGTWRHPSKGLNNGGGGSGGGNWGKPRLCLNIVNKGMCRTKQCPFRHPSPR